MKQKEKIGYAKAKLLASIPGLVVLMVLGIKLGSSNAKKRPSGTLSSVPSRIMRKFVYKSGKIKSA